MSRDKGYVAIFRDIFDHWIWKQKPFSKGQAWVDLILLANHTDEKQPYKDTVKTYERGKVYKSKEELAERWGWNRKTVKRFVRQLQSDKMITEVWSTQGTTLTIVNYDFYQSPASKDGQRDGQRDGQGNGQRWVNGMVNGVGINKNYKNDNNYKNDKENIYTASPDEDEDDYPYGDDEDDEEGFVIPQQDENGNWIDPPEWDYSGLND